MNKEEKIIMYDSDEAAQLKTITGWISSNGQYWGKDEAMARYAGCTHKTCECGKPTQKHWIRCEDCRRKADADNYSKMPFVVYDGQPVYCLNNDKWFFSSDDIESFLEDEKEDQGEFYEEPQLRLVIGEERHLRQVDYDYFCDDLPEDGELDKDIADKLDEFNKFIKEKGPTYYMPGKNRTVY